MPACTSVRRCAAAKLPSMATPATGRARRCVAAASTSTVTPGTWRGRRTAAAAWACAAAHCLYRPVFVDIYLRQLRAWGFAPAAGRERALYRRYSGDLVALGKGELLCVQPG